MSLKIGDKVMILAERCGCFDVGTVGKVTLISVDGTFRVDAKRSHSWYSPEFLQKITVDMGKRKRKGKK